MPAITVNSLLSKKNVHEKFCCITAYDATFARLICETGIEAILVGDSLGMVLQGHDSTLPVSVTDIAYHTAAVVRGIHNAKLANPSVTTPLIIADMPFMSYSTSEQALQSATKLMQTGAHMIKMEGGRWLAASIEQMVRCGIPVCGHLGLTPQSVNTLGGFKVQGRLTDQAEQILTDAQALEQAGAQLLVLECIPQDLANRVCTQLSIPVIGIGAGPNTDAQVLVLHDLLGLNPRPPRFVKNFMSGADSIAAALNRYATEVRSSQFPSTEHCFE